ncbi:MAG: FliA/WhiG family RNA polymerase sigma factor [Oscillospiraceae bacterium]
MSLATDTKKLTDEEFEPLFAAYRTNKDVETRNKLILGYSYIPRTVAAQLRGISQGYAQIEDMVNQGILTLMDCLEKFDPDKGIRFEYYAFMRVRGGVIDLVRKQDWIPRRVREMAKKIAEAQNTLANRFMREPTYEEISEYLDIPVKKLYNYSNEINNSVVFSFEELIQNLSQMGSVLEGTGTDDASPEKNLIRAELIKALRDAIEALSERERLVVTLYYYENLMLADIAQILEISVQRVSQINARAVAKLKTVLAQYVYGD